MDLTRQRSKVILRTANPFLNPHAIHILRTHEGLRRFERRRLLDGMAKAKCINQPDLGCLRGEPEITVVLAQEESVLSTGGEETVGLNGALGDEVVDHHSKVGFGALEVKARSARHFEGRIRPCHETLTRRLLVA